MVNQTCARCGTSFPSELPKKEFDGGCPACLARMIGETLNEPRPGASTGGRFGKYVRTEPLGAGGMGEVWKAWDADLDRWVALKFIKGDDPAEITRFKREAQTAAQLSHPNIAAVFDVGEAEGRHFIAMQFVPGLDLTTYPRNDRRRLVELLRDAASAVHYAHTKGIVHRDLKPANLMVGEEGRLFVMDFGLAKRIAVQSSLSVSGLMIGTPTYMSPEQAQGRIHDVDARSDVYSLGATLYELLADRPPFRDTEMLQLLLKVVGDEPRPLRQVNRRVDRDLETIVMKCLEKSPGRRYESAKALADDLGRWLAGEPVAARPASFVYRLRRFAARRKAVTALVIAMALVVPAAALIAAQWIKALGWLEEARLFLPLERDLDVLREKFYRADFRFKPEDFDRYEELTRRIREQMSRTGEKAHGYYLIGRCWETAGNLAEADRAYGEALARNPEHPLTLMARGRLAIERAIVARTSAKSDAGRAHAALEEARAGAELIRRGAAAAGENRRMEQDLADAYVQLVRDWPKPRKFDASSMMAKWPRESLVEEFLLVQGLSQGSERPITEALAVAPSWPRAWFYRSFFRETVALQVADLTRALEINPRFAEAWNERGAVRGWSGEVDGVIADFDEALRLNPSYLAALTNRASVRLDKRDFDGALADCEAALRINPRYALAYVNRGRVRHDKGDFDGAIADAEEALRLNPRSKEAYGGRGLARKEKGDVDGAIADYGEALKIDEEYGPAYNNRGIARRQKGDVDGAIADFTKAVLLPRPPAAPYFNRGTTKAGRGDVDGALADYEAALRIDPRFWQAYLERGIVRRTRGNLDGAIADFGEVLRLSPHAEAHVSRGNMLRTQGDPDGALADYEAALRLDPQCANAYACRGALRKARGDLSGAATDLDEAARLDPRQPETFVQRGLVRKAQGDMARARADFMKALDVAPADWPHRAVIEEAMRALGP